MTDKRLSCIILFKTLEGHSFSMQDEAGFGFSFSLAGAIIMGILYALQVTETAEFFLRPSVTAAIGLVALVGALLFYWGGNRNTREM